MYHTPRLDARFSIAAACFVALTTAAPSGSVPASEQLASLLIRYDREPEGPARALLAARIDAIAHQKYATVSRLYWHTDLPSAQTAAREQGRPILHLRMLGRLDEDLSCTNSRLFRATLYANQDLSAFLRERFVLYWSSERPAPRVTIDFGDGRTLERTTAGNSAHYVLDEDGNVLDVLPGLYAPAAFRHELEGALSLTAAVHGKSHSERARLVARYHEQLVSAAERDLERLAGTRTIPGARQLLMREPIQNSVIAAERATVVKMAVERRDLRLIAELAPDALPEDQRWSAAGQVLYAAGGPQQGTLQARRSQLPSGVLDEASRGLIVRLYNAGPVQLRATDADLSAMLARLERSILGDSALNQLRLRPQISREIVSRRGQIEFATLNAWIYAQVFRTPTADAWLGLLQRDVFTGLPGDGVVLRSVMR